MGLPLLPSPSSSLYGTSLSLSSLLPSIHSLLSFLLPSPGSSLLSTPPFPIHASLPCMGVPYPSSLSYLSNLDLCLKLSFPPMQDISLQYSRSICFSSFQAIFQQPPICLLLPSKQNPFELLLSPGVNY